MDYIQLKLDVTSFMTVEDLTRVGIQEEKLFLLFGIQL